MPTMSIEVLCVKAKEIILSKCDVFAIDSTFPPKSDRSPSIWQNHMDRLGGVLVHIFDPQFKGNFKRWAYDIIEEENWKTFRFKDGVRSEIRNLMISLIKQSPERTIFFYSDAQWSNRPLEVHDALSIDDFFSMHDREGITMNKAIRVTQEI